MMWPPSLFIATPSSSVKHQGNKTAQLSVEFTVHNHKVLLFRGSNQLLTGVYANLYGEKNLKTDGL